METGEVDSNITDVILEVDHPDEPDPGFPFLELPQDIQVNVIGNLDFHDLHSLLTTSEKVRSSVAASKYPEQLLRNSTRKVMGAQISNLMLGTVRLLLSIQSGDGSRGPAGQDLENYFKEHLDSDMPPPVLSSGSELVSATSMICKLHDQITLYLQEFVTNHPWIKPDAWQRLGEVHQEARAMWRTAFYEALFFHYAPHFGYDLREYTSTFFFRLAKFELHEIGAVTGVLHDKEIFASVLAPHVIKDHMRINRMNAHSVPTMRTSGPNSLTTTAKLTEYDFVCHMMFRSRLATVGHSDQVIKYWDEFPESNKASRHTPRLRPNPSLRYVASVLRDYPPH